MHMQGPLPKHPPPSAMAVPPNNEVLMSFSRPKVFSFKSNILMTFFYGIIRQSPQTVRVLVVLQCLIVDLSVGD